MDLNLKLGLANKSLAFTSFVACQHPAESCGHNGLPLTPNSIGILGQAEVLKSLEHDNLCSYLDFKRGRHERIICVSEFYGNSFKDTDGDEANLVDIASQVLQALDYLSEKGLIVVNLSSGNVLFDEAGRVKLYNYGLGHMTNYGVLVSFPLFDPRIAAPEVLESGPLTDASLQVGDDQAEENIDSISHILPAPKPPYEVSASIWSLGMIIFAKAVGLKNELDFWSTLQVSQVVRKVLSLSSCQDILGRLGREFYCEDKVAKFSEPLASFLKLCLVADPEKRGSPRYLLSMLGHNGPFLYEVRSFPTLKLRCANLELSELQDESEDENCLEALTLQEIYYLWVLAGGDILGELRRHGLLVSLPPILALPKILLNEGHPLGQVKERCTLYDPKVMILPMTQLMSCLKDLTPLDAYPLLLGYGKQAIGEDGDAPDDTASLPLVIKERDVKYQFKRTVLYRRLLQAYPLTKTTIWKEARRDTLPLYRALIWASLLGIDHDVQAEYEAIDKEAWTPTDRQIEVDIPRCHQYNSLLASSEGHRKFKRILKAWVATNPQYVYWQGLDSLCAPFLYLNFNDEALAFACLSAFIPKYLHGMFRKDNAAVIQEYLAKFSHLQAFHEPELFNHLDGIGFIPELYAIPWVLTMFAHVFPLHNIFHLWDKLLLGNESFPLCVALAILQQLKAKLLESEFNDCILLFSDLPAIDIEQCVNDSIRIFCSTPKSLTYRKYGSAVKRGVNNDFNDLTLNSITLEIQKRDKVPRMSGEELLSLLGLAPILDESLNANFSMTQARPKAVAIDVRPKADFKIGALPDSINIPLNGAFNDDGGLLIASEPLQNSKLKKKSKIICVVGWSNNDDARLFAENLLRLNHNRVCYLHGGIEVFRTLGGVLCVPDT